MKTTNRKTKWLAYGLCLAAVMYNCKTKEIDSLTPFSYTFKGLDDVKLPDLKQTTPAPVIITPASSIPSAKAAAVSDGLKLAATLGEIPSSVKQASDDIGKVLSEDQATTMADGFTTQVLEDLTKNGTLPASLKSNVASIFSNETMKAYLPAITFPTVNGKLVSARISAHPTGVTTVIPPIIVLNATTDDGSDKCKKEANKAFDKAQKALKDAYDAQVKTIDATYKQYETAASADYTSCQSGLSDKYKALIDAAKTQYNVNVDNLKAAKKTLGEKAYKLLVANETAIYAEKVNLYNAQLSAELKACAAARDAKIAAAKIAYDQDLATINTRYNTAVAALTAALNKSIASCHNQGNGG